MNMVFSMTDILDELLKVNRTDRDSDFEKGPWKVQQNNSPGC